MPFFGELFISEVIKKPVFGPKGEIIGRVKDIVVVKGDPLPKVSAIIIEKKKQLFMLKWEQLNLFNKRIISTNLIEDFLKPYHLSEDDMLAVRDILHKQIVDVYGAKVVRAYDIKIESYDDDAVFIAIDVGVRGIIRRLGLEQISEALLRLFKIRFPHHLISWNYIQPLIPKLKEIALTVAKQTVSKLHPADIAEIMSKVSRDEGTNFFRELDVETAADVFSELNLDIQAEIITAMDASKAADMIEEMPPDEAADILSNLPPQKAQEIHRHIEKEEAEDIQELLLHKGDTAGGLMTNEFIAYTPHITIQEALNKFKEDGKEIENIYNIYIEDETERLIGVISLRELLIAKPEARLAELMETKIMKVLPDEDVEAVAGMMSKYDLVAIPVVNVDGHLLGIVTVDDIMDVIEEEATEDLYRVAGTSEVRFGRIEDARPVDIVKSRLPWLFVCLIGGMIASIVIGGFEETLAAVIVLAAFIPVIMGMAGNAGLQISTTMVRGIALDSIHNYWRYVAKELAAGAMIATIAGGSIALLTTALKGMPMLGLVVGISMFVAICTSVVIAIVTPTIAEKMGIDPAITAGPFVTVFNDILGITIYFVVANIFMKYLI